MWTFISDKLNQLDTLTKIACFSALVSSISAMFFDFSTLISIFSVVFSSISAYSSWKNSKNSEHFYNESLKIKKVSAKLEILPYRINTLKDVLKDLDLIIKALIHTLSYISAIESNDERAASVHKSWLNSSHELLINKFQNILEDTYVPMVSELHQFPDQTENWIRRVYNDVVLPGSKIYMPLVNYYGGFSSYIGPKISPEECSNFKTQAKNILHQAKELKAQTGLFKEAIRADFEL